MKSHKNLLSTRLVLALLLIIPFFPIFRGQKTAAQEQASDQEATVASSIEEDQDKIDDLREEIKKKVEEKLETITSQKEARGWVGVIEEKGKADFKIKVGQETRTINLADEIKIIDLKRREIEFEDLEVGQRAIFMGYLQADGNMEVKRITLLEEEEKEREIKITLGVISDKSEEEEILSITPFKNENGEEELVLTSKTIIYQKTEKGREKIKYDNLEAGQKIAVVSTPAESNGFSYSAKLILVFPPSQEEAKEEASPTPTTAEKTEESEE